MKEHFCPAEKSMITYQDKCNWCGESEGSITQEVLKLALEALQADELDMVDDGSGNMVFRKEQAIIAIKEALAQTQEPVAVYGYCPECGAKGVMRERRPNGNDKCANGHTYPSSTSTPPQRTWVDLTAEQMLECNMDGDWTTDRETAKLNVQAKLKELNT